MKRFVLFIIVIITVSAGIFGTLSEGHIGIYIQNTDPLISIIILASILVGTSFIFGCISGDYSWVDRLWSMAPVAFAWIYAISAKMAPQTLMAALLITIWGVRLTFNFARKGGYSGTEDYRWAILRKKITKPVFWQLFHFFFICCYQIGLFVLFTSPLYLLYRHTDRPVTASFVIPMCCFFFFLVFETIADQQQWNFHRAKKRMNDIRFQMETDTNQDADGKRHKLENDIRQGFLSSGLFHFSRHPNYFGEIMQWWCLFIAGIFSAGSVVNWTWLGPMLLTLLFIGSTRFTESISAQKYPGYTHYQQTTSAIIPFPPSRKKS